MLLNINNKSDIIFFKHIINKIKDVYSPYRPICYVGSTYRRHYNETYYVTFRAYFFTGEQVNILLAYEDSRPPTCYKFGRIF